MRALAIESPLPTEQLASLAQVSVNLKILRQRLYDDIQLRQVLEQSIETIRDITTQPSDCDSDSDKHTNVISIAGLTQREIEVLECLLQGDRPALIASRLQVALNTVRRHLSAIYRKLNVTSQVECIRKFRY
ncbi:helix-turn-helix transcriptional regulator [uncultured Umboniibacter sp.]|uniref:response regulator transcription factor n=1 Tax=uncultured Umboniibacter sp. TaxID=1798917 RepID=UPI002620E263|nr:helix-turn-helix transcriptional regulator [uncultured Umboniibacter sp.]